MMIDTPEGIEFYRLASLKGQLKMEMVGLKGRGPSAYSVLKSVYKLKGNRQSVLEQTQKMVDDAIAKKESEK